MSAFPRGRLGPRKSPVARWDDASLWAMAERLAAEELRACDEMMADLGSPAPRLLWRPGLQQLPEPLFAFLLGWWEEARAGGFAPPVEALDPVALKPALGHLSLLQVVDGGADFQYRVHGSLTAARVRWEWTGRRVSRIDTPMRLFFLATYRAVTRRPEPLLATHTPPMHVRMTAWHRLILPLRGEGAVTRLLVGILPTERQDEPQDGRQPKPRRLA